MLVRSKWFLKYADAPDKRNTEERPFLPVLSTHPLTLAFFLLERTGLKYAKGVLPFKNKRERT